MPAGRAAVRFPDVAALQLPFALGYVSLIGAVLVMPTSLLTAPLGVRAAHAMSKRTLEMAFGCYLFIVGGRFVISLLLAKAGSTLDRRHLRHLRGAQRTKQSSVFVVAENDAGSTSLQMTAIMTPASRGDDNYFA